MMSRRRKRAYRANRLRSGRVGSSRSIPAMDAAGRHRQVSPRIVEGAVLAGDSRCRQLSTPKRRAAPSRQSTTPAAARCERCEGYTASGEARNSLASPATLLRRRPGEPAGKAARSSRPWTHRRIPRVVSDSDGARVRRRRPVPFPASSSLRSLVAARRLLAVAEASRELRAATTSRRFALLPVISPHLLLGLLRAPRQSEARAWRWSDRQP